RIWSTLSPRDAAECAAPPMHFPCTSLFRSLHQAVSPFEPRDGLEREREVAVEAPVELVLAREGVDGERGREGLLGEEHPRELGEDRKSTRLNSSHVKTSYAVFCSKKKKSQT